MIKNLTVFLLFFGNAVFITAQDAILPVRLIRNDYLPTAFLPKIAASINIRLKNPMRLSANLPAGLLNDLCPLEITDCPYRKTKYLIIVTLDGFRWQEVFTGADSTLLNKVVDKTGNYSLKTDFWAATPALRRQLLLPFLWDKLVPAGQILGNRRLDSEVNVSNKICISYPGYSEIFTGYADDGHIYTNFKIKNRNTNVLDFINSCNGFGGRVASFASWDVFSEHF